MIHDAARGLVAGALLIMSAAPSSRAEATGPILTPLPFTALTGWAADDHEAALATFRRTCETLLAGRIAPRPAAPPPPALLDACREAIHVKHGEARGFFEARFVPCLVTSADRTEGFLTGYFEPEYLGALERGGGFETPLLERPADLVTIPQGETWPGLAPDLRAARRAGEGFEPYPDRAAIETGALGDLARPVVWLRSAAEAFIIHVQGSARIRLPDGTVMRVGYAGRNGHPFTAIGRVLVERGTIPLAEMNLERLTGWLEAHPEEARELMRLNRSYIFFTRIEGLAPGDGPVGGAGVPLTAGRSLAVDRTIWSYGLPVWLEGELPQPGAPPAPLARLMVAQDTGSAIVGPMRGDFFTGSGRDAGTRAGLMRQPVRFVVLRPRETR